MNDNSLNSSTDEKKASNLNGNISKSADGKQSSVYKRVFIASLPHITISTIFLIYLLFGAAILKEIESDSQKPVKTAKSTTASKNTKSTIQQDGNNLKQNEAYSSSLSSFVNDLKQKQADLRADYVKMLEKTRALQEKMSFNYDEFLNDYNETLNTHLKLTSDDVLSSPLDQASKSSLDSIKEVETYKLIAKLYEKHPKAGSKKHSNTIDVFKEVAKHLIEFKNELKQNLLVKLGELVVEFKNYQKEVEIEMFELIDEQNEILDSYFEDEEEEEKESLVSQLKFAEPSSCSSKSQGVTDRIEWHYSTSFYFVSGLITTIGFGNIEPKTVIGKFFTMIYLIIGIPLALILVSALGGILTRFLKFIIAFMSIVYNEGYLESIKRVFNRKKLIALFSFLGKKNSNETKASMKLKRNKSSSDEEEDNEDETFKNDEEASKGVFQAIKEISHSSFDQIDDIFDLSFGLTFGLLFFYLTVGAFVIGSRTQNWSLFNGYYFSLLSLTKIGMNDLLIKEDTRSVWISCLYTLLGVAYFDLALRNLQERMRLLLTQNAKRILDEIAKFSTQFGYNFNTEQINFNLSGARNMTTGHKLLNNAYGSNSNVSSLSLEDEKNAQKKLDDLQLQQHRAKRAKKSKDRNELLSTNLHDTQKCDKQTQITTLLYSRFKDEKYSLMTTSNPSLFSSSSLMDIRSGQAINEIFNHKSSHSNLSTSNYSGNEFLNPIKEIRNDEEKNEQSTKAIQNTRQPRTSRFSSVPSTTRT